MELVIKNKVINGDLNIILEKLRTESGKYHLFSEIKEAGADLAVTCPYHKEGKERHASCYIYNKHDRSETQFGMLHCFTCAKSVTLPKLVADCFGVDLESGEEWLFNNFAGERYRESILPEIKLNEGKEAGFMDEKVLKEYDYYHPYMWQRKLSKEVVDRFRVGYDATKDAITFPVWDDIGRLRFITARSTTSKKFYIPREVLKPVYLLNFIKKENITDVYVCESQINALYVWTLGYPAVALFGTGSKEQMPILNKSGIRRFKIAFDGDYAGDKGINRLIRSLSKDKIIDIVLTPRDGRDVNDLSKEEFDNLKIISSHEWRMPEQSSTQT